MTSFTPYGSISLDASPLMSIGKFTDSASIAAENVRVYNAGTVEIFVGFGKSTGDGAVASVPNKNETNSSFPIPPKESEVLYKGTGNDQVAVITAGGLAPIRVTAVKLQNSGGDLMSSLELIAVLKDAMGSQKLINAAIEKIANANNISEEKRKEAEAATKVIADAKIAASALEKEKNEHLQKVSAHRDNIIMFNSQTEEVRKSIETERAIAKAEIESQLSDLVKAKTEVQSVYDEAARHEEVATAKEKATTEAIATLEVAKKIHESEKKKLEDAKKEHEENVAKFLTYKTNLENALKGK